MHHNEESMGQSTLHAIRPEDLQHGVSFPVGMAAWIWPKVLFSSDTGIMKCKPWHDLFYFAIFLKLLSRTQSMCSSVNIQGILSAGVHLRSY